MVDVLASKIGGVLSVPSRSAHSDTYIIVSFSLVCVGSGNFANATSAISDSGLAVVLGNIGTCDWFGAGRWTSNGRPIYLHTINRSIHNDGLGRAGRYKGYALSTDYIMDGRHIGGCCFRDMFLVPGRTLAKQHHPLRTCTGGNEEQ